MAYTETMMMEVQNSADTINSVNEKWEAFGWSVLSIQIIHSENTKTYTKGLSNYVSGDQTVETTVVDYAAIVYQRDKTMLNYNEIASLEDEYYNLIDEVKTKKAEKEEKEENIKSLEQASFSGIFRKKQEDPEYDSKKANIENQYTQYMVKSKKRLTEIEKRVDALLKAK